MIYVEKMRKNCYFIDKSEYIEMLEMVQNPIFLRPKRYNEWLFCSMLDIVMSSVMPKGSMSCLRIAWPVNSHLACRTTLFLSFDPSFVRACFSSFNVDETYEEIRYSFRRRCNRVRIKAAPKAAAFRHAGHKWDASVSDNLGDLLYYLQAVGLPPLYVIIDQYDNFANQLITGHKDQLYNKLTTDGGFFKTFFKTLKEGRKIGAINNVLNSDVCLSRL